MSEPTMYHEVLSTVYWQDATGRPQAALPGDLIDTALVKLHPEWVEQGMAARELVPWTPDPEFAAAGWYR